MSDLDQFGAIRVFLAAAELGSFSEAARKLALSPSAIAKSVARPESRLGTRLFERTTRQLVLTSAGKLYRATCEKAVAEIIMVEKALISERQAPIGKVKIELPPLYGTFKISPILFDLCDRFAGLSFDISLAVQKIDLVKKGVDVAVRIGGLPNIHGVTARYIGLQELVLCAHPSYLKAGDVPKTVSDLSQHVAIVTANGSAVSAWQITEGGELKHLHPSSRLRLDGVGLTLLAIRNGRGIGMVPRWLVEDDLALGDLLEILPGQICGHLPIHVIWPRSPVLLPKIRVTVDAIVDSLAPRRGADRGCP